MSKRSKLLLTISSEISLSKSLDLESISLESQEIEKIVTIKNTKILNLNFIY